MNDRRIGAAAVTLALVLAATTAWAGAFEDIEVGKAVDVEGRLVGTRTLRAQAIELQQGTAKKQEIAGDIEMIDADAKRLQVLGTPVSASDTTVIQDEADTALSFASLKMGRRVKVEGRLGDDNVFHAVEIELRTPKPEVSLEGVVEAIDPAQKTITVVGFTVAVTPTTRIEVEKK